MTSKASGPIRDFYLEKTVFITGVTGTVGKILLERLLRYCHTVQTIFVLIRPSLDASAESRLEDLLSSEIFATVRANNEAVAKKVVAVSGDLTKPGIGVTNELRNRLIQEVEVVFHCGANVKFNLPLDEAIRVNCGGSRNMLALFVKSKRLVSYVHVSTVFLKTDRYLEETVQELPTEFLNVSGNFGNTYVVSKLISENEVNEARFQIPIAIARLPIVSACHQEPIPGYVDSLQTTTACMRAIGSGAHSYTYASYDCQVQIVPADVCANFLVAAAWARGTSSSKDASVYNLASANPPLIRDIAKWWMEAFAEYPVENMLWYPTSRPVSSWALLKLLRVLFVYLPALVLDFFNILQNKVPGITKMQFIVDKNIDKFAHFNLRSWDICMGNTIQLAESLQGQDQENFPIFPQIDWEENVNAHYRAIRKYCLKMGDEVNYKPELRSAFYREIFRLTLVPAILAVIVLLTMAHIKAWTPL